MDGGVGGWMDGWVGGWTRREKEEGRLEHKELPAKVVITAALTAEPTPGRRGTDDVSKMPASASMAIATCQALF